MPVEVSPGKHRWFPMPQTRDSQCTPWNVEPVRIRNLGFDGRRCSHLLNVKHLSMASWSRHKPTQHLRCSSQWIASPQRRHYTMSPLKTFYLGMVLFMKCLPHPSLIPFIPWWYPKFRTGMNLLARGLRSLWARWVPRSLHLASEGVWGLGNHLGPVNEGTKAMQYLPGNEGFGVAIEGVLPTVADCRGCSWNAFALQPRVTSYSSGNAFPSLHPWGGVGWLQNRCGWCKLVSCGMSSFSPKRRLHDSHRLISFKEGSESVSSDQQNCIPRFQTPEASASNYGQQSPKQHAKCRISLRRANLIGAAAPHAQGHNEAVAGASREADLLQWQFFTEVDKTQQKLKPGISLVESCRNTLCRKPFRYWPTRATNRFSAWGQHLTASAVPMCVARV